MPRKPWADRGSRHERGYGWRWEQLRASILKRDRYLCQPCFRKGRITAAAQVDHVKPKARGGTDDPGNLESTCCPCHDVKSAKEAAEAQGRTYRRRRTIAADGWPADD